VIHACTAHETKTKIERAYNRWDLLPEKTAIMQEWGKFLDNVKERVKREMALAAPLDKPKKFPRGRSGLSQFHRLAAQAFVENLPPAIDWTRHPDDDPPPKLPDVEDVEGFGESEEE
jgi:hypothetical protein